MCVKLLFCAARSVSSTAFIIVSWCTTSSRKLFLILFVCVGVDCIECVFSIIY